MPVELSIVESVTELETTVVQVVLESASAPGPAGPGLPAGGTVGQVPVKQSGTDYDIDWEDQSGGGVTDADYLVGTAHAGLSAEIVVGTSPGGELGGTWASPTVDATHSGSSHAAVQAAAEATAAAALASHETDQSNVHGIADTTALALTANHPSNATFNDHSARHEDGGADEIDLTGLSGTPAALTTHEADTTNVHGIADTSALLDTADIGSSVQAFDSDLGAIAGLSPSNDDVIQRKTGAWTNRSMAQLIADLGALGTTFQPLDGDLTALAGLTSAANKLPYFTGAGAAAVADFLPNLTSFTPTLTATTTSPTLGSGSSSTGRYGRIGNFIFVLFEIVFGSSGVNAGSGTYEIALPVTSTALSLNPIGFMHMLDSSSSTRRFPDMVWRQSTTQLRVLMAAAPGGFVAHNSPWTWAASDALSGIYFFEAA